MFKRKIYDRLLDWKKTSNGDTALLIEGARRIGKSTLVDEFGKNEYKSYIIIDFAFAPKKVLDLFNDMSDLNFFFLQLQLFYSVQLYERESLIIFDEVQFCPLARQAIKRLVQDHRYDYIETGSLISIKDNVKNILIPSEERSIQMYPMDYEEFKWAIGDTTSINLLRKSFESRSKLGEAAHRKLIKDFRLYMLIGGMPQAIKKYIETNNFEEVDKVKRDIIKLYKSDFVKLDSTGKAELLFNSIPAELNKNSSRYNISSVIKDRKASDLSQLILKMKDSKTVLVAYQTNDPNIDLANNRNNDIFKMYLSDTGLFVTLLFYNKEFIENDIYEKLLYDKLPTNLGYLYENIVAQILTSKGIDLYYHSWYDEISKHNQEIDFLITRKNKIVPIEVKSSKYATHASFDKFTCKFSNRIGDKYIIYTREYKNENGIEFIPIYYSIFL